MGGARLPASRAYDAGRSVEVAVLTGGEGLPVELHVLAVVQGAIAGRVDVGEVREYLVRNFGRGENSPAFVVFPVFDGAVDDWSRLGRFCPEPLRPFRDAAELHRL